MFTVAARAAAAAAAKAGNGSWIAAATGPACARAARYFGSAAAPEVAAGYEGFETLLVSSPAEKVMDVRLNRPKKSNAMNQTFWREMREVFAALDADANCRAIVLSGAGKNFTAGLDLADHQELLSPAKDVDMARRAFEIRRLIKDYQDSFTAMENCIKPVVAAIHGACVGGGVDMVCAADIRFCTADSFFCIKEVAIGLAADVGTLQRMPKVMGNESLVRELALTARNMEASEALSAGLVSAVLPDQAAMWKRALECASSIASHSPVAIMGTKENLNFSRDHSVDSSLRYMQSWNQGMLQTQDIPVAATAFMTGTDAKFEDA